jgi:hypothetical protein
MRTVNPASAPTQSAADRSWILRTISPTILLKAEGLALAVLAIYFYWRIGDSWLLFVVLILAPDLSFFGYLAGPKVGAVVYNTVHAEVLPAVLLAAGVLTGSSLPIGLALIWLAHIGGDRLFAYGLKYPTEFKDTHLQRV